MHRICVILVVSLIACPTLARRKCEPETRCANSPDLGLSDMSTFFPPKDATAEQLARFRAGMKHSKDGKSCIYGHTDLDSLQLPLSETKKCFDYEGSSCGFSVTEYYCTCAPKERVRAAYDPTSFLAGGVVLSVFGGVLIIMQCFLVCKDYCNGDLDLPECDGGCDQPGILRFWSALCLMFLLPLGFLGGAAYCYVLYARDPEMPSTWGYWRGCGTYTELNPANTGGKVFIAVMSVLILGMLCCACYGVLIGRCSSRSRRADTLQRELRIRSVNLRRDIETASAAGATSVALTQSRSAQASGDDRRRLQRSAIQRSAQRLGELSLELVHPTRVARSVSARRFDTGRLAPVVRATALGTVVKAGFMTKVVPSFVGKSMRRYFVLFSADSTAMLAFYDEQKDPPESATCLGKAELGKIESVERKRLPRYPQLADHGLLLTFSSRAVAWELDAGDEANQGAWEEAINVERSRLSSVELATHATVGGGTHGGATPVVVAEVLPTEGT